MPYQQQTNARLLAWCVHFFTASGMIAGFLALVDASSGRIYQAVVWLILSIAIDGIDGTFARLFKVKEVLPRMDGKMIDAAVDFVNYVITPAFIFYQVKMVPQPFLLPCIAGIIYSSLYHIGNTEQLTADNRIKGFPAWWNLVVYYLWILDMSPWINMAVVLLFIILHFVPVTFIYLSRLRRNIIPAAAALLILLVANTAILVRHPDAGYSLKIAATVPLIFLLLLGSFPDNILHFSFSYKKAAKEKQLG